MVIIFLVFLMFDQIFLSAQVKRSVIKSNKHNIYELSHELLNDLSLGSNILSMIVVSCSTLT